MDILIAFLVIVMVYIYGIVYYFYTRSKNAKKRKSVLMVRGITHLRRGNLERAQFCFENVYASNDSDCFLTAESLYYMAIISSHENEDSKALEFLQEAIHNYEIANDLEGVEKASELILELE